MKRNLPKPEFFLQHTIPGRDDYKIVRLIKSGLNGLMFEAFATNTSHTVACKIIPRVNLVNAQESQWLDEIRKVAILSTPVAVRFQTMTAWLDEANDIDCVLLFFEYIPGIDLREYIKQHLHQIRVGFIEDFLKAMFALLHNMEQMHVRHGDIHAGNVLVEDCTGQLGGPDYRIRVTDFGVTSATSESQARDDYDQTALILQELLANINYQDCSPLERYTYNVLNTHFLARHLTERDRTRDQLARNPEGLYHKLLDIPTAFHREAQVKTKVSLSSPFDYLSCEQIGDSHGLLRSLYSNKFLGVTQIEDRNNLVLTGPRGCGKTTVFKSLSLQHRLLVSDEYLSTIPYIGIYYRCDDLYGTFPRYEIPSRTEAIDLPMHFISATLISQVLETIEQWTSVSFPDQFRELESKLTPITEPSGNTFEALKFAMAKQRKRARLKHRFTYDHPMEGLWGPDILPTVCAAILRQFPSLDNRPFYFFVDDYSMPKITLDLQKNLNRLFMQRTSCCFFKLSTESPVSYARSDIDGKSYVEGREFQLLNLGLVFLHAKPDEKLAFIEDVFARRFGAVEGYPVKTLLELLGESDSRSYNDIARAIRNDKKLNVWGRHSLSELCSGDVFYLIGLVGRMIEDAGGASALKTSPAVPKLRKEIQADAIRSEAGSFLQGLRGTSNGEHLVHVVTAFAVVAFSYLKFRDSKNESSSPPYLASRIEPYEDLNLGKEALSVYRELLRYSLFIEDPRGKSRRGKVVPRLYLRRCLLPHFGLTFSRRDSVELEPSEIEGLLLNPNKFEDAYRLRKPFSEYGPSVRMGTDDVQLEFTDTKEEDI